MFTPWCENTVVSKNLLLIVKIVNYLLIIIAYSTHLNVLFFFPYFYFTHLELPTESLNTIVVVQNVQKRCCANVLQDTWQYRCESNNRFQENLLPSSKSLLRRVKNARPFSRRAILPILKTSISLRVLSTHLCGRNIRFLSKTWPRIAFLDVKFRLSRLPA